MSEVAGKSCRHAFTETLVDCARKDARIFVVTSDARGSVTLGKFAEELPQQFVELGIAEQNVVGVSAGLARSGKRVFACGPASFYSARSFEQVKNDVAYANADVRIIGVSGGVSYGALGSTHHSLHDIAAYRSIPNLSIIIPSDARQTSEVTAYLAATRCPAYLRVGRAPVPDIYHGHDAPAFTFGRANRLAAGDDCAIIATGETVFHALAASRLLAKSGIHASVLDMATVKPLDGSAVLDEARKTGCVLTVEEHSVLGGLGSAVAELLSTHLPTPMDIVGFPDEFAPSGSSEELFAHYGITGNGIAARAEALVRRAPSGRVRAGAEL